MIVFDISIFVLQIVYQFFDVPLTGVLLASGASVSYCGSLTHCCRCEVDLGMPVCACVPAATTAVFVDGIHEVCRGTTSFRNPDVIHSALS